MLAGKLLAAHACRDKKEDGECFSIDIYPISSVRKVSRVYKGFKSV